MEDVGGGPKVHETYDRQEQRITLVCDDAETFERLRAALYREAGLGLTFEVPSRTVRAVSVELAAFVESVPPTVRDRVFGWGCMAALVAVGGVFLIGVLALIRWIGG